MSVFESSNRYLSGFKIAWLKNKPSTWSYTIINALVGAFSAWSIFSGIPFQFNCREICTMYPPVENYLQTIASPQTRMLAVTKNFRLSHFWVCRALQAVLGFPCFVPLTFNPRKKQDRSKTISSRQKPLGWIILVPLAAPHCCNNLVSCVFSHSLPFFPLVFTIVPILFRHSHFPTRLALWVRSPSTFTF